MKPKHIPIAIGTKFQNWTVIGEPTQIHKKRWHYLCRCEKCQNTYMRDAKDLRRSDGRATPQCKLCYMLESGFQTHGSSRTRPYRIWRQMKARCEQKHKQHASYFDRGITICAEWSNPDTFLKWAMDNGYQDGLEIDRKDNDGNYEPSNCRWTTHRVNCNNRRNTTFITVDGDRRALTDWLDDPRCSHLTKSRIRWRINNGWSAAQALDLELHSE